jgi:uncharacterized protein YqgC (DUF456 family)
MWLTVGVDLVSLSHDGLLGRLIGSLIGHFVKIASVGRGGLELSLLLGAEAEPLGCTKSVLNLRG